MQLKILSKRTLLIATLSGIIFFTVLLLIFILKNSTKNSFISSIENVVTFSEQKQKCSDSQFCLKIPSIKIDAPIKYIGLATDGTMGVPKNPTEVALFSLGPRPGENGTAVIAGHYGWKNSTPAVFDNLYKLQKGDKISVKNEKGVITNFVVREIKIYSKDEAVPDVFNSSDLKAHLNLITCTGIWNKEEKTRSERLVVFTDKE